MHALALICGTMLCLGVVLDAFQTIILPRRPTGRFRITSFFYRITYTPWVFCVDRMRDKRMREQAYSIFGPISLLLLLGVWASILVIGFALIYFAAGTPFADALNLTHTPWTNYRTALYVSGTTLFTLGLGDVTPLSLFARVVVVMEAGTGLGFVALVIGYVPVLYQAFSRREVSVALLDGRAGSPPTATELLRRHGHEGGQQSLITLLIEWERWSAEVLESHVSYPLLCYYRSQHDNQSWLSAMIAMLDACALLITTVEGEAARQAQLTFAVTRHALVDLGYIFNLAKRVDTKAQTLDRLPPAEFSKLCDALGDMHLRLCGDPASLARLTEIRSLYEPHALALSVYLRMPLPLWIAEPKAKSDIWKQVAGLRRSPEAALKANEHISESAVVAHLHGE